MRTYFIVPFTEKLVSLDVHRRQFFVAHLDFRRVAFLVEFSVNLKSSGGAYCSDQIHDDLQRLQRNATPFSGAVTEQAVFDLVPLARAGRVVADLDRESRRTGESLEFKSPELGSWAVAPAQATLPIGREALRSLQLLDPNLNAGTRKAGGLRNGRNASSSDRHGLGRRRATRPAFIKIHQNHRILAVDRRAHDLRLANREVATETGVEGLVAEIREQILARIRAGSRVRIVSFWSQVVSSRRLSTFWNVGSMLGPCNSIPKTSSWP